MTKNAAEETTDENIFGIENEVTVDFDTEIERLAKLPEIQYERERKAAATRLSIRTAFLDKMVQLQRNVGNEAAGQGQTLKFTDIEPWPEEVEGSQLLDDVTAMIRSHIIMGEHEAYAVALWAVHTHCYEAFYVTPKLAITAPERNCGKSLVLDILTLLVNRPVPASNATIAALYRTIEKDKPTVLIDEAETFLHDNEELRGILNSGHHKRGQVLRCTGDDHDVKVFSTWAPVAIALIGRLPDTLESRSIPIRMRRKMPGEHTEQFRAGQTVKLERLARKIVRWARDNYQSLCSADPEMHGLFNRDADNWHPLFAIADIARGDADRQVREAAKALTVKGGEQTSRNELLLSDIKSILESRADGNIASAELVKELTAIEERPWGECNRGKAITAAWLSRRLAGFGISSNTIRTLTGTAKGYKSEHFSEAFKRYLPENKSVTPSQIPVDNDLPE